MLRHLVIKNFAVIEDISIEFKEGMNVLIGETGAGKSIIIDALSLLKGEKSMFDKIRVGEEKAYIEGEFIINNHNLLDELKKEYNYLIEDETIIVSRSLDISIKSSAKVNYHAVPISILKKITEKIIDIHSQHKNNIYFDESRQLSLIDKFIMINDKDKFDEIYSSYQEKYNNYLLEVAKLNEMIKMKENIDDLDYLTYQYDELSKANLKENEIENVEKELKTLESFEEFASIIAQFDDTYANASSELFKSKKLISSIKNEDFSKDIERFISSYYELEDAHEAIMNIFNKCANDLDRIDYLKQRKSLFASLKRKYGNSTEEILEKFENIKKQIEILNDYEYNYQAQQKLIKLKEDEALIEGKKLSTIRLNSLKKLEGSINQELHDLLLENAEFKVNHLICELNENGIDEMNFMLKANVGGKFLPLKDCASLGETSRINLAIKNVFNSFNPVETIIFDEIDTGISGRVAIATAKKIHNISKNSQSIVISHLPQVASCGDHHYMVKKEVIDNTTKTSITELKNDQVIKEIAHIISGNESEESINIVKSLINEVKN